MSGEVLVVLLSVQLAALAHPESGQVTAQELGSLPPTWKKQIWIPGSWLRPGPACLGTYLEVSQQVDGLTSLPFQ